MDGMTVTSPCTPISLLFSPTLSQSSFSSTLATFLQSPFPLSIHDHSLVSTITLPQATLTDTHRRCSHSWLESLFISSRFIAHIPPPRSPSNNRSPRSLRFAQPRLLCWFRSPIIGDCSSSLRKRRVSNGTSRWQETDDTFYDRTFDSRWLFHFQKRNAFTKCVWPTSHVYVTSLRTVYALWCSLTWKFLHPLVSEGEMSVNYVSFGCGEKVLWFAVLKLCFFLAILNQNQALLISSGKAFHCVAIAPEQVFAGYWEGGGAFECYVTHHSHTLSHHSHHSHSQTLSRPVSHPVPTMTLSPLSRSPEHSLPHLTRSHSVTLSLPHSHTL